MLNEKDLMKKTVGEKAVTFVEDGMKIGLGSGSTVYWMIRRLGERIKEDGIQVEGIPSSEQTAMWAKEFGVPLTDFATVKELDITIDGADEVDENLQLIKGGGAALFREKIIAQAADKLIIIVDDSKMVETLGKYPLPVEVLPFGWERTASEITKLGCTPDLRMKDGKPLVTDNGNYILDCPFGLIESPRELDGKLQAIAGVIETGLFVDMTSQVILSDGKDIRVI